MDNKLRQLTGSRGEAKQAKWKVKMTFLGHTYPVFCLPTISTYHLPKLFIRATAVQLRLMSTFRTSSTQKVVFIRGCPLFPFLFRFFVEVVIDVASLWCLNSGIPIYSDKKVPDFEYADCIALLVADPIKLQAFLVRLNDIVFTVWAASCISKMENAIGD